MHSTELVVVVLVVNAALTVACQPAGTRNTQGSNLGASLQTVIDIAVRDDQTVHGAALHVHAPPLGLTWEGAAGMADPGTAEAMTPAHPVRIASNTKTFVAAAVLRLWEEGRLGLDDPISGHLSEEHLELLHGDGYRTETITIRHLLTHTSGLYDHSDGERYGDMIVAEPQHLWTRTEQVRGAIDWGEPLGDPEEFYHYCDTGYILLGEIIERNTGQSLAAAIRQLVDYERLGLGSTWFETVETPPLAVAARAHQFLGELDVTDFHPSFDLYGGGGIACTMGDLARFTHALFSGGVYTRPTTLDTMLTTVAGAQAMPDDSDQLPPGAYRMGVWEVEAGGLATYRHTGFWGTLATYIPELDITVTVTVNQNQAKQTMIDVTERVIALVRDVR